MMIETTIIVNLPFGHIVQYNNDETRVSLDSRW